MVELTAEPQRAKVSQTVRFESTTEIKGCDAGQAKYTLYIDGKTVDVATSPYQGLDYDLEFNFNTAIPSGLSTGEHTAEVEVAFTVDEAEKKSAIGSIIKDWKTVRFTVEGKEDVEKKNPNIVPNCPVPTGAEYEEHEDGWRYSKDGIQTGPFIYWDTENHNIILSRGCMDEEGELQGKFESWYGKNKPKEFAEYAHGMLHGKSAKWKENGDKVEEITYKMGKRHGEVTHYDRGELISAYHFQDGKMDGPFKHYYRNKNGRLYLETTGQYSKGRKVLEKHLHESGVTINISTRRYAGDDTFEDIKYFKLDGTMSSDYNYLNGEEHGTCTSHNGQTIEICQYDKGVLIKCENQ